MPCSTRAVPERLSAMVEAKRRVRLDEGLEQRDGALVIRGYSCPLASVTTDHPEVCRMAETLITEVAGVPVYEHCDRGDRPRCCFEVANSDSTEQK